MATYNLPGVYTLYQERKPVVATTNEPATDQLLFFGTATDGPKFVPINVSRPQDALNTFGEYPIPGIGSPLLVPAVNEAYYAGARNITCVRISGVDASMELADATATVLKVYGKYPGTKYNDVQVEVTSTEIKVWNVADSKLNKVAPSVVYTLADYATLNLLAGRINADSVLSDIRVEIVSGSEADDPSDLAVKAKDKLTGGDDEITPSLGNYDSGTGLRGALAEAYEIFVEYQANLVVPLGVSVGFTNDATPVFDKTDAQKLAEFCFEAAKRNNDIIGAISFAPIADTSLQGIKAMTNLMAVADNTYKSDNIDIGRYINIIVGEPIFSDNLVGNYANLGAACYFGLASKLPPQSGTTNKTIAGATNLRFSFSPAQTEALRANKFTVLKYKIGRGVVVVEGLLGSLAGSDFQALSTVRIIHSITNAIRNAVDPFIGEPLDIPHINSIETALRDVLATYAKNGAITSGNFDISLNNPTSIIGDIDVELDLEIPSELRRVKITVSRRYPTLS